MAIASTKTPSGLCRRSADEGQFRLPVPFAKMILDVTSAMKRRGLVLVALGLLAAFPAAAAPHGEILWDRYGVAHVYAKDTPSLFRGYGWAQAQSHGDALLKLYAQARGRAAEYFGQEERANDRWMAINDVRARSADWLSRQSPEFRANLEAFAAGINDYAKAHPDAISVQAQPVLPVSAQDVVGHALRLFQYIYIAPMSLMETLPPDAKPIPTTEPAGSNGFAIAPSRSADGHVMLLMNPHLPWETGWSTYYEIQLTAPSIDLYGASQLGLPVLRFMFSDTLAFTQTVNSVNGLTLYRLTPDGSGYRFDGKVQPFGHRTHSYKVLQPDGTLKTESITVRTSIQGPVIAEKNGAPVALRVAGLDRPFGLEQYWRMATAKNFAGYESALRALQVPSFNIIYADRDGNIQYLYNGLVPKHSFGDLNYWKSIVPGDNSRTLWNEYLTYDALPKVTNPPGGVVHNSNDPPWNAAWPTQISPEPYKASIPQLAVSLRAAQGTRLLGERQMYSFEDLVRLKWTTHVELADRVLPDLLEAVQRSGGPQAKAAAEVLSHWDRTTQADSRGTLLFLNWSDRVGAASGYAATGFARPYRLDAPLTTPAGLADPDTAVVALDAAATDMLAKYGQLDKPWGEVMRLKLRDTDLPANGGPGRLGNIDVLDFAPAVGGVRAANFGGSFVAAVSFNGAAKAKVLLSYGNASQPGSPHAADQLPLLSSQTLRDAWRTRADVEANLEHRETY